MDLLPEIQQIIICYLDYITDQYVLKIFLTDNINGRMSVSTSQSDVIRSLWLKNSIHNIKKYYIKGYTNSSISIIKYTVNGITHRENDEPAVIKLKNNLIICKKWYKYGEPHRENGPAIEYLNGNKKWYKNGKKT